MQTKHPLQAALEREGLTQREFSKRVSLREETISLAIHGKRVLSRKAKERIGVELGMNPEDLRLNGGVK
jgi:plasmid maintenance system antidote protein VapI